MLCSNTVSTGYTENVLGKVQNFGCIFHADSKFLNNSVFVLFVWLLLLFGFFFCVCVFFKFSEKMKVRRQLHMESGPFQMGKCKYLKNKDCVLHRPLTFLLLATTLATEFLHYPFEQPVQMLQDDQGWWE